MPYSSYFDTTDEYQQAVLSSIDESTISASFEIVKVGFGEFAISTEQGSIFSNTYEYATSVDNSANGMSAKFASLEAGRIKLDGSYIFHDPETAGLMPGEEFWGTWFYPTDDIILRCQWGYNEELPGISIIFDDKGNEYATHISIDIVDATGTTKKSVEITDNSSSYVSVPLGYYMTEDDEVIVTIYADSWTGTHYIKVAAIRAGIIQKFTGADILSFDITEEGSPFNSSFIVPQATLTVDNSSGFFSILGANSISEYLQKSQEITVSITIAGYEVIMCAWYLYDWSENHGERSASFVLKPEIGFERRFTTVALSQDTIDNIITDLNDDTGHSFEPYWGDYIGPFPWDITANRYFGEDQQADSSYQQVANAVGCYWDQSREYGNVAYLIQPKDCLMVRSVTESVQLESPQISLATEYKDIVVQYQALESGEFVSYSYTLALSEDSGESFTVYAPQLYTQAQAQDLAIKIKTFLEQRVKITVPIKGDPALRPFDVVDLQMGDGVHTEFNEIDLLLTKVQTTYSDDILTSTIEGIGVLP